jgi:hypothetical protein
MGFTGQNLHVPEKEEELPSRTASQTVKGPP